MEAGVSDRRARVRRVDRHREAVTVTVQPESSRAAADVVDYLRALLDERAARKEG